jgi:hypothetical protein
MKCGGQFCGGDGYFGPNALFGVTAIPEPTSLTLMVLAFLGMTAYCLRRRAIPVLAGKRKRRMWCS